ncbi:MAG: hypothetical protein KatS3mg022_2947 [Armatimonadota bacterium]|nr:MAG: hypothetical protein KatS3mg022_2947 [Armatimonadota bacterium]
MHERVLKMIENLETPGNRLKTGLLLVPPSRLAQAEEIAARLLADVEDIAQIARNAVPQASRYAGLGASRIGQWLDDISQQSTGQKRALVVNLDLLLAGVSESERAQVWYHVRQGMPHRRRVVLVLMPDGAEHLLPPLQEWEKTNRCARL